MKYLPLIESTIQDLNKLQKEFNENYDSRLRNNNYQDIKDDLFLEKSYLERLTRYLNKYFDLDPIIRMRWTTFKIERGVLGRYEIIPPLFLKKGTIRFIMLKKCLTEIHRQYFLNDGKISYAYTSIEHHMWEIPDFIENDELVKEIRRKYRCIR